MDLGVYWIDRGESRELRDGRVIRMIRMTMRRVIVGTHRSLTVGMSEEVEDGMCGRGRLGIA